MADDRLRILLHRVQEAKADYGLALAQILDDAKAAGIAPAEVLPDLSMASWVQTAAKKPAIGNIYFAKVEGLDVVKVGFSHSVPDRMRALRLEHRRTFEVLGTVAGTLQDERWLHNLLSWCQDRTLRGNEFFAYGPSRGLIRIFLGVADRFPFDQPLKEETFAWVNRVREAMARGKPSGAEALKAIGEYFDKQAAQQPGGAIA
jgi:hypothetical protein